MGCASTRKHPRRIGVTALIAVAAALTLPVLGCRGKSVISEEESRRVSLDGSQLPTGRVGARPVSATSALTGYDGRNYGPDGTPRYGDRDTTDRPGAPLPQRIDVREMLADGKVPPIPQAPPREVEIDHDRVFAQVNGDVISIKDVRSDLAAAFLDRAERYRDLTPTWNLGAKRIDRSINESIRQNLYRKLRAAVYRQEAAKLRDLLGSIPARHIEDAIAETKQRHGIYGTTPADEAKWAAVLARANLSYFDFEQQILDQIEQQRTVQFYAYSPTERLGWSFDISPQRMRDAYERDPIVATTDVKIVRVSFPLIGTEGEVDDQTRVAQYIEAESFVADVKARFIEINRQVELSLAERDAKKTEAVVQMATTYRPEFAGEVTELPNLADVEPDVAETIRRLSVAELAPPLMLEDEVAVVYLVTKTEAGYEPFTSPVAQKELRRRLLNRIWNDFRRDVDRKLLGEATITFSDPGAGLDLDR
jgi:hypothetical protein